MLKVKGTNLIRVVSLPVRQQVGEHLHAVRDDASLDQGPCCFSAHKKLLGAARRLREYALMKTLLNIDLLPILKSCLQLGSKCQ